MANILNKLTKQYLRSVNTPDFSPDEYLINPVLPPCDQKFWVIEGDTIREMTQPEKDAYLYLHESTIYLIAEKQLLTNQDGADYEADTNAIINPVMPNCNLKYTKAVSGEVVEMSLAEQDAVDLAEAIPAKQTQIKQECTAHILAAYPEPIQRSAAMGIYSANITNAMAIFIAGCIEEENRCYDALEAATTLEEVDLIAPVFPEA
ncbi:hypothetical protein KAW18_16965 [candidate division WOR-3 bacterium]|nr:hypothetical protein [candidate division WOR-3 bacterium]